MKNIIIFIICIVCILQGIGAGVSLSINNIHCQHVCISFTDPTIQVDSEGSIISFKETTTFLHEPGKPYFPAYSVTYTYPFGTIISDISSSYDSPSTYHVAIPIQPLPAPTFSSFNTTTYANAENLAYQTDREYPAEVSFSLDTSISEGNHVLVLTLFVSPFEYSPTNEAIICYATVSIDITFQEPETPITFPNEYDMVIIAPSAFTDAIQPLITHKNSLGLPTFLKTTEEIYMEYPGVDNPEQIKYFIKDAIETFGIQYVLLIGGRIGGVFEGKWLVPVRYSLVDDTAESSFISDLYFADIYNETGKFTTWDTNGNGIIGEWKGSKKDIVGLLPDVYLGRLPCMNAREVQIAVDKIITYETTQKDAWFNDMVVVGGDSAPGDQFYEGEEENQQALLYMEEFTGIKCWTSDQSFTGPEDVINAISQGCGFLFFDGHANPASWSTHPPGDEENWINGLTVFDMSKLSNKDKLPICVVGGCHIAQFDVSPCNILRDLIQFGVLSYFFQPPYQFYHMEWVPKCWSWQLASMKQGGSIATCGYTGLDWFAVGDENNDTIPDCTQQYSGFMNTHFFKNYGINHLTFLGQIHTQTIIDYITTHPPMKFELDCKTAQEFVLLGDPSLRLGE